MCETCQEFVERIWGKKLTEREIELLLWLCTNYPRINVEELEKQLVEVRDKAGGDIGLACKQASEEI